MSKRIVLIPVEKRNSGTLKEIIKKYVYPVSIIYTDCWRGYNGLEKDFKRHQTVNHRKFFKDPVTQVYANTIEGNWAPLKIFLPNYRKPKNNIWLGLLIAMERRNSNILGFIKSILF